MLAVFLTGMQHTQQTETKRTTREKKNKRTNNKKSTARPLNSAKQVVAENRNRTNRRSEKKYVTHNHYLYRDWFSRWQFRNTGKHRFSSATIGHRVTHFVSPCTTDFFVVYTLCALPIRIVDVTSKFETPFLLSSLEWR